MVAELTGVPLDKCKIGEDACRACLLQAAPRQQNSVTASIAIQIAKKHLPPAEYDQVRSRVSNLIEFVRRGAPVPATGPGTELKKVLSKIGIKETPGCGCASRAREMDHRGVEWCQQNIDTIVGWLKEEAEKQGLPFVDFAARLLIKYAIRRASK